MPTKSKRTLKFEVRSTRAFSKFAAKLTGIGRPAATAALACLPQFIANELAKGYAVRIPKLGTFILYHRKPRTTQAVMHGKMVVRHHPDALYPRFKSATTLKKAIHKLIKKEGK